MKHKELVKILRINAIITRGDVQSVPNDLEETDIKSFINDLPGYSAQVLTFGFMIGFLIVIAAIVIGIFIYVLTMQKAEIFGVMKAQGISSPLYFKFCNCANIPISDCWGSDWISSYVRNSSDITRCSAISG